MGPESISCGVKLASLTAYLPAIDGGSVTSIASSDDLPSRLDAAAAITHGPPAGEPTVLRLGPSLPAATTATTPALAGVAS